MRKDQDIGHAARWSYSKYEKRWCIMLTDVTEAQLGRLIKGAKQSRLATEIQEIINENKSD